MFRTLVLAIVSAALVAGLAPAHASVPAPSFVGTNCFESEAFVPQPVATARLPPGYSLVTLDPAGAAGIILVSTITCDTSAGRVDAMTLVVPVVPPAQYQSADFEEYGIVLDMRTDSPAILSVVHTFGFGHVAHLGTVSLDKVVDAPGMLVTRGVASADGGTYDIIAQTAGMPIPSPAGRIRGFAFDGDTLVGDMAVGWSDQMYTGAPIFGSMIGPGSVRQVGPGALPTALAPVVTAHAFDYALSMGAAS